MGQKLKKIAKTSPVRASLGTRELSLLLDFSKEINKNLNLDRILQCFTEKVSHLLKTDSCLIHLLNDEGNSLKGRKRYNLDLGFSKSLNPKEGMAVLVFRDKKAVILSNIHKNPHFLLQKEAQKEGFVSAVCLPLQGSEKPIGILTTFSRKARRYSKKDLFLLDSFAAQAAVAIANAQDYERIKKQLNEISLVKENTRKNKNFLRNHITQTEKSYQKLFDAVNDAIFSLNQEGYFATFNRMFLKMTGYTENEIKSLHFSKILHPEDRPMMVNDHQKVMRGEYAPGRYTFRLINKEERIIYVEGNFRRLKENNEVVGILAVLRDVTERRTQQNQLLQSHTLEAIGQLAAGVVDLVQRAQTAELARIQAEMERAKADELAQRQAEMERAQAAELAQLQQVVLDQWEHLRIQPGADQDPQDSPQQPIHSTLTEGPRARAGPETEVQHPSAENGRAQDVRPQQGGLDVEVDQTEVLQQVDPDHAGEHPAEHDLEHREVSQPEESHDLFVPGHLRLLQDKPEGDAGQKPKHEAGRAGDLDWSHVKSSGK